MTDRTYAPAALTLLLALVAAGVASRPAAADQTADAIEELTDLRGQECDFVLPALRDYIPPGRTRAGGPPSVEDTIDCVEKLRRHLLALDPSTTGRISIRRSTDRDLLAWANRALARAEAALRRAANQKRELMGDLRAAGLNPQKSASERQAIATQIVDLLEEIEEIDRVVSYSQHKLFVNFEDYDDYFFRFPVGYEILEDDPSLEQGFPRVGFLVSSHLGGGQVHDLVRGFRGLRYGPFLSFTALITSSAEQSIAEVGGGNPAGGTMDEMEDTEGEGEDGNEDDEPTIDGEPVEDSFEFEAQLFLPIFRSGPKTPEELRIYVGPIVTLGGRKIEDRDEAEFRRYGGLRFSSNPELYWDLLFGESDGLDGTRIEVRGQLPVHRFEGGNRLYLGGIGNFALDGDDGASDVIRLYVVWNIDVKGLFNGRI